MDVHTSQTKHPQRWGRRLDLILRSAWAKEWSPISKAKPNKGKSKQTKGWTLKAGQLIQYAFSFYIITKYKPFILNVSQDNLKHVTHICLRCTKQCMSLRQWRTLESHGGLSYSELNHACLSWHAQMHVEVKRIYNTATLVVRLLMPCKLKSTYLLLRTTFESKILWFMWHIRTKEFFPS